MNVVQVTSDDGARRVAMPGGDGRVLHALDAEESVRDLALETARRGVCLDALVAERVGSEVLSYNAVIAEKRLLPPIDYPPLELSDENPRRIRRYVDGAWSTEGVRQELYHPH